MSYNWAAFRKAERYYKNNLRRINGKSVLVIMDVRDEKAYYSVAPLSKAIHDLGKEMYVVVKRGKSKNLEVLFDVWKAYEELEHGIKTKEAAALKNFIDEVEKKTKGRFKRIFKKSEIILEAKGYGFDGTLQLRYEWGWLKKRRWNDLIKTGKIIWKDVYNIKNKERVNIIFELVPDKKHLELPLNDYLDSFLIARAMLKSCNARAFMGASSARFSVLEPAERISDLNSTLIGCELSKKINEPVFVRFKKVSGLLKTSRMQIADAVFAIHGKGFGGKHLFGEVIGYPSPNRKTRWSGPGGIIYKPDSSPQTLIDERPPKARLAFTETLPIEVFIETCAVDWKAMRRRNKKIKDALSTCSSVRVCGTGTCFEALLKNKNKHRWVRSDDGQVNKKVNEEFFKMTGAKAWMMGNLPGGEVFVTPERVFGKIIGDVVISIDQSYKLSKKEPLVINVFGDKYNIVDGPKRIIKLIKEKKRDALKVLMIQEKNKSLPKEIIKIKRANFNRIGELGINTNPKAKLCKYLVVNEKIANMLHVALGAGFEADRNTEYHYDIVIDAKSQKLDVYGIKGKEKRWILKRGRLVT